MRPHVRSQAGSNAARPKPGWILLFKLHNMHGTYCAGHEYEDVSGLHNPNGPCRQKQNMTIDRGSKRTLSQHHQPYGTQVHVPQHMVKTKTLMYKSIPSLRCNIHEAQVRIPVVNKQSIPDYSDWHKCAWPVSVWNFCGVPHSPMCIDQHNTYIKMCTNQHNTYNKHLVLASMCPTTCLLVLSSSADSSCPTKKTSTSTQNLAETASPGNTKSTC